MDGLLRAFKTPSPAEQRDSRLVGKAAAGKERELSAKTLSVTLPRPGHVMPQSSLGHKMASGGELTRPSRYISTESTGVLNLFLSIEIGSRINASIAWVIGVGRPQKYLQMVTIIEHDYCCFSLSFYSFESK